MALMKALNQIRWVSTNRKIICTFLIAQKMLFSGGFFMTFPLFFRLRVSICILKRIWRSMVQMKAVDKSCPKPSSFWKSNKYSTFFVHLKKKILVVFGENFHLKYQNIFFRATKKIFNTFSIFENSTDLDSSYPELSFAP